MKQRHCAWCGRWVRLTNTWGKVDEYLCALCFTKNINKAVEFEDACRSKAKWSKVKLIAGFLGATIAWILIMCGVTKLIER